MRDVRLATPPTASLDLTIPARAQIPLVNKKQISLRVDLMIRYYMLSTWSWQWRAIPMFTLNSLIKDQVSESNSILAIHGHAGAL